MKRCIDIVFSLAGIIILLPLLMVLAIWILLDSRGPAIYKQKRVGLHAADFKIFKFRTMRRNADKMGLLTVGGRDNRITRAGYWLRKFKLDELPQLFNVLKGDMSLVGPRPEVRKYVDVYSAEQRLVLTVKPGITDLASIQYFDENEQLLKFQDPELGYITEIMPVKLSINLEYVRNQSFSTDMKIIFLTVKKIFRKDKLLPSGTALN